MREKRKGFTLVELMVAALLAGVALVIALPLILVGRNTDVRTEKREAVSLAGEAIYEYVADELKFAGRLYIGDLNEKRPEGENWKSITVSKKDADSGETYARLLYGAARELTAGEPVDAGTPLYDLGYQEKTDLVLEVEAVGRNQLRLTVKLMDGEQALYEKTSVLSLLNLTLNATNQIEGYVGKSMTIASKENAEGKTEQALVLWYQNSRETVKPFEDGVIDGSMNDPVGPGPDQAVVSLANPQYVKVGETAQVQYLARAEKGKRIITYDWSLQDNQSSDSSYYVEEPMDWNETSKSLNIKGLNVSPENKNVRLTLVVTFEDGTTASDSCDVIVYEGYKPGEGPVDHFVIVPENQEEEYKNEPEDVPVWIKKGTNRVLILDAVDKDGELTKYDVKKWGHPVDGQVNYWTGFNSGYQSYEKFTINGKKQLYDNQANKRTIYKNDFEHYAAEVANNGVGSSYQNSIKICFGLNNEAAYPAPGKGVSISRAVAVYDPVVKLSYSRENDNTYTAMEDENKVNLLPGENEIRLSSDLIPNPAPGTPQLKIPQIDPNSIKWTLERQGNITIITENSDTCRLEVGEGDSSKLSRGDNVVKVEFKDTAGYSYTETIIVTVPSEIAYVEFDEDSYTLLRLDDEVEGVSVRDIGFKAKDIDGNYIDEEILEAIFADGTYLIHIKPEDENPATQAFSVEKSQGVSRVKAVREGRGNLILELQEAVSGKIIKGEGDEPCSCPVEVKNLSLELKLKYIDHNWSLQMASIQSGQSISAIVNEAKSLRGFDVAINLPDGLKLSAKQEENLKNYKNGIWNKVEWTKIGDNGIFSQEGTQNNEFNIRYKSENGKTGTSTFIAKSSAVSDLTGTVTVIITKARAKSVTVSRQDDSEAGKLVIYGDTEESRTSPAEKFRQVILRATVIPESGTDCDKEVAWSIVKGKDLVDTSKLMLNTWTDSESYMPKIQLRDGLTDEEKDRKIVVRVTSRSSGTSADYTISLLPQFRIVNPDSAEEVIELIHKASGSDFIFDTASLEANQEADWTINTTDGSKTYYLAFSSDSGHQGVKKVILNSQNILSGMAKYVIKAQSRTTGQTDSRIVIVEYSLLDKTDESSNAWIIKFNPSGLLYMEVGDVLKNVQVKGGWVLIIPIKPSGIEKDGGDSTRGDFRAPGFWEMNGSLTITAVHPGTTIYRATTGISTSRDYIKIIVRGLEFKMKKYSFDIKKSTVNLANELYRGEISNLHWESSNPNIADFKDESGILTLKDPGKTKITVSGYEKSGGKYTAECEVEVDAEAWGQIYSVSSSWKGNGGSTVNLLAGSQTEGIGVRDITSVLTGDSEAIKKYPVYCIIEGGNSVIRVTEIPSSSATRTSTVRAIGAGTVKITPAAAKTFAKTFLMANVYELEGIDIEAVGGQGMIHLITGDKKTMTLKASVIPSANNPSKLPESFEKLQWKIEEGSEGIIDYKDNGDGTCTVTAKDMGTAYITCYSPLNPDIYETYVVIVSF